MVAQLADLLSAWTSSRRKAGASGSCSRHASLAIVVIRSRRPSVPALSTATAHMGTRPMRAHARLTRACGHARAQACTQGSAARQRKHGAAVSREAGRPSSA